MPIYGFCLLFIVAYVRQHQNYFKPLPNAIAAIDTYAKVQSKPL